MHESLKQIIKGPDVAAAVVFFLIIKPTLVSTSTSTLTRVWQKILKAPVWWRRWWRRCRFFPDNKAYPILDFNFDFDWGVAIFMTGGFVPSQQFLQHINMS